jgi:selenocysteine lyase/cysteine desulfurase
MRHDVTAAETRFTRGTGPIATDTAFWSDVAALHDVDRSVTNLENGYWGVMAKPVLAEYIRQIERVNRENTILARSTYDAEAEAAREALARVVGVGASEIAFTRGATEALQLLISNYNGLEPGDAVAYCDLDYDSMQYAMAWLKDRRGVEVVTFAIPEPATRQAVLDAYAELLADTPKLKLLLVTHVSHRTGLVMPVADIAAMAKAKGVDVILDAAHSWGQIDFAVKDLGVDFIGFNLHKWIGAPLGLGFVHIARDRLDMIDRAYGDLDWPQDDIRSRVHTGTTDFATVLTLPAALRLHEEIGAPAKAARLRHLRDVWVAKARTLPGVEILTPDEAGMAGGITSFRLAGKGSKNEVDALRTVLREKYAVLTVRRAGIAKGQALRVTPAIHSSEADVERLAAALAAELGR